MSHGRKEALSVQALQFVDAVLVYLAFVLSAAIRVPVKNFLYEWNVIDSAAGAVASEGLNPLMPLLFVIIPLTPIALEWFGFYRHPLRKRLSDSLVQMIKSLIIVGGAAGVFVILLKLGM